MTAQIIRGDARALPLADASVDLVVTSPPYFGLRSYQDGGEHYAGQIGAEPTPAEFVDALIAATSEMVRVLKPSGSLWVNLGDKYAGQGVGSGDVEFGGQGARNGNRRSRPGSVQGVRGKSLIGIPWRYAIRCIDDLGLILRAEVIWSKPNGLPESVTDRVRRSHETWFHFVKQPRYFSAVDEIREATTDYSGSTWSDRKAAGIPNRAGQQTTATMGTVLAANPLGKLPGSVWTVPTQPLRVPAELGIDHFAAFPMEWPRRIIQGWSPAGVCSTCGEGRRPVTSAEAVEQKHWAGTQQLSRMGRTDTAWKHSTLGHSAGRHAITGYACACPDTSDPTIPAVVLDPFGGTGTTALMAKALGRTGISVDMSQDYSRLATWRTNDPGQLAAALQVEKPDVVHPDQLDLFGEGVA